MKKHLTMKCVLSVTALLVGAAATAPAAELRVSPNQRYLLRDGKPFFYLADTARDVFLRLNREEADEYLKKRADQGFNVITVILIGHQPSADETNAYGEAPLIGKDPARPNEKYFQHVVWRLKRS